MIVGLMLLLQMQVGVAVRPETVTVGQHFTATVRVRAPQGAVVQAPVGMGRAEIVDTAGRMVRRDTTLNGVTHVILTYTLAAWDTGTVNLGLGDVVVEGVRGEQRFSLNAATVRVRSVLPADPALRVPKPPRPLIEIVPFNWLPWIIAAVIAALIALAAWCWAWYRRRSERPVPPLTWAEREFRKIEGLKLLEQGASDEYAIRMTTVLREYLTRQFSALRSSATTRELATLVHRYPIIPFDRTIRAFERVDLLKFARGTVMKDEAQAIGVESRALVQRIDEAVQAERAAQAGEAGAKAGPKADAA